VLWTDDVAIFMFQVVKTSFFSGIKPEMARKSNAKGGSDKCALLCQGEGFWIEGFCLRLR
jgi:hypothetical protein